MNNLVFYTEDGEVQTELQKCMPEYVSDSDNYFDPAVSKLKRFTVVSVPSYLKLFFHGDISKVELAKVYDSILYHGLIKTDKEVSELVNEDFEHYDGSIEDTSIEIKCHDFREAFLCGLEIMEYFKDMKRVAVQLSDEPSRVYKKYISEKEQKDGDQREKHA